MLWVAAWELRNGDGLGGGGEGDFCGGDGGCGEWECGGKGKERDRSGVRGRDFGGAFWMKEEREGWRVKFINTPRNCFWENILMEFQENELRKIPGICVEGEVQASSIIYHLTRSKHSKQ